MTASADIEALWSPEGQVAALAAALVALSDALGLAESDQLDAQLSSPDFDFSPACAALDDGAAVEALLRQTGLQSVPALNDVSLLDTSLMILCQDSLVRVDQELGEVVDRLLTLTEVHQLETTGLKLAQHLSAALQIQMVLAATRDALPAQVTKETRATAALANALALTVPDLPWLEDRWPVVDQVSGLLSLSTLLAAFEIDVQTLRGHMMQAVDGRGAGEVASLAQLYGATAQGLEALTLKLDQWSADPAEALDETHLALVQGALARAREVLEAQSEG
ncbi:MAG: hypothetical protein ACPG4M_03500 [Alphaproteobacteria bacterium]